MPLRTYPEAAEELRVSMKTLSRIIRARQLAVIHVSSRRRAIEEAELERFKKRRTQDAANKQKQYET